MKRLTKLTLLPFAFLTTLLIAPVANADDAKPNDDAATEARLGIGVTALPDVLKSHLPKVIDDGRGILVSEVVDGSPADKAGIRQHDVLIRYDDQDLCSPEQLVKRVRNDEPGNQVGLQFVRASELKSATVTLGKETKSERVVSRWNWPDLVNRFDVPWSPLLPEYLTEAQDTAGDGTEWTSFESLSVTKQPDGSYAVRIAYTDTSGNSICKEFRGERQQIRDEIESDNDLPQSRKDQLLRTLDDRGRQPLQRVPWEGWNRELFSWPNVPPFNVD